MANNRTKQDYVDGLSIIVDNFELPKDVADTILSNLSDYRKNKRNLTMGDITDTISYIESETGKTFEEYLVEAVDTPPVVENSTKEEKKELPKKPSTKEEKKDTKKADKTPIHELINTEMLKTFPKELTSVTLGATLKLRLDIKDIKDVALAYNNGQDIVLATYWTKRHLQQYADSYDPMGINPNHPKSFENDLDLVEITYANELVVTGCSLYSYVPHTLVPKDFTVYEDDMRYCNGMEFQVYELVDVTEK